METLSTNLEPPKDSISQLPAPLNKISKQAIRTSLGASTIDGVFAAVFNSITTGVLLTNFLLGAGANSVEIGMLSSIPLLLNLLQPLGAYFTNRTTSLHNYCLTMFGGSRLLWLFLAIAIGWINWFSHDPHQLVNWTLGIILAASILACLGGPSWVSWMAALVPHRLRGRYFGLRNSAASLTTLVCVPLFGFAVSAWPKGEVEGYEVVLLVAIVAGIVSLACQFYMADVNPQLPPPNTRQKPASIPIDPETNIQHPQVSIFKDTNFLIFLLYFGLWTFAVNLSSPFFNLYLLDDLNLDLNWVTIYISLVSGANLVMLLFWGRLADRWGNRPLLISIGILVAVSPLFWLGVGNDQLSLWIWLPLVHIINGGAGAAIDLCSGNIQMEVAPATRPAGYFAIAAAIAGVSGGLGATAGGFLAGLDYAGGLPGIFALSALVRILALIPLIFVREPRSQQLGQILRSLLPFKSQLATSAVKIVDQAQ